MLILVCMSHPYPKVTVVSRVQSISWPDGGSALRNDHSTALKYQQRTIRQIPSKDLIDWTSPLDRSRQALSTDPYGHLWKRHARARNAVLTRSKFTLLWSVISQLSTTWLYSSYTFILTCWTTFPFLIPVWCIPIFKQEMDMAKYLNNINPHAAWIHKSHLVCSFTPEKNCTSPSSLSAYVFCLLNFCHLITCQVL